MAVEIKQIVIRAVLTNEEKSTNSLETDAIIDKEFTMQECVAQVLKILEKKNRR